MPSPWTLAPDLGHFTAGVQHEVVIQASLASSGLLRIILASKQSPSEVQMARKEVQRDHGLETMSVVLPLILRGGVTHIVFRDGPPQKLLKVSVKGRLRVNLDPFTNLNFEKEVLTICMLLPMPRYNRLFLDPFINLNFGNEVLTICMLLPLTRRHELAKMFCSMKRSGTLSWEKTVLGKMFCSTER